MGSKNCCEGLVETRRREEGSKETRGRKRREEERINRGRKGEVMERGKEKLLR